jgi:hypothetical protein
MSFFEVRSWMNSHFFEKLSSRVLGAMRILQRTPRIDTLNPARESPTDPAKGQAPLANSTREPIDETPDEFAVRVLGLGLAQAAESVGNAGIRVLGSSLLGSQ